MADEIRNYISKITLPGAEGDVLYYVKDSEARDLISTIQSGSVVWAGVTTTELTDGCAVSAIIVGDKEIAATQGLMAAYKADGEAQAREFIYNGEIWQELGGLGLLKALAYKDEASAEYTPAGTLADSEVTFADTAKTSVLKADTTFTITAPDITLAADDNKIDVVTAIPTATVPKTVANTTKYITPATTTVPNVTDVGSVGSAASWSANVENENLSFSWKTNVPTSPATLGDSITVVNSITSEDENKTGAIGYIDGISVSETDTNSVTFAEANKESVLKSTLTATAGTQTISIDDGHTVAAVTGNGTAAAQEFTGTKATITVS